MDILITESQYQSILLDEKRRMVINMFENLSEEEKKRIIDIFKIIHPTKTLNEAWWNTIGDVIGFIDPTGIVDFVNGLDYIRQGDYFFGFLSIVSVVPFADFVTKPIIGMSKFSKTRKGIDAALKIAKNAKTPQDMLNAQKILQRTASVNPDLTKLMMNSDKWGTKLKQIVDIVPNTFATSGMKKTINNWIDLFSQTSLQKAGIKSSISNLAKKIKPDPSTSIKLVDELKSLKKVTAKGPLSTFQIKDPDFMLKYFWPGLSLRTSKGRQLIGMMRRTKFYAGFLDYMGIANFVGPDELIQQEGSDVIEKQMKDYANTPLGKEYYQEDMNLVQDEVSDKTSSQGDKKTSKNTSKDPIDAFFDELF